ncbi:MAG: HlyD family type I secretion periplasmic adaptor subunit [Hyphomicrobium sp.]|jgi:hemolysin D
MFASTFGKPRDSYEFLPAVLEVVESPPRPAARILLWLLMLFFAISLTWSILGRIDQVATATGQIVPGSRVKLIQPIENGVVRAISVHDGRRVKAGDVLVELDPTEASASAEAVRSDLTKARLDAAVAQALLAAHPEASFRMPEGIAGPLALAAQSQLVGEVEKLKASVSMIEAEIAEQHAAKLGYVGQREAAIQASPLIAQRLEGLEELEKKQLVRLPDITSVRQQRLENQSTIHSLGSSLEQADSRIESKVKRREEIISTARADALQRQADALRRIATLEQQLRREERREGDRRLLAPVDGIVVGLSVFTIGGVVTTKDVLMRLVPDDAVLEAEVVILNKDIGFVREGMPVEVKLETFPFTRYGLIPGNVKQVWHDAIQDEKQGLIYKAEVTLHAKKILVGDKMIPLSPGMSVQAEIKTGDRRVISYFLSPLLRYQDESLRER